MCMFAERERCIKKTQKGRKIEATKSRIPELKISLIVKIGNDAALIIERQRIKLPKMLV